MRRITIIERLAVYSIIAGIGLFALSLVLFLYRRLPLDPDLPIDTEKFSHFGHFVGGVIGSIWTLGTLLLLYVTLRFQREELHQHSEQVRISQQELDAQLREITDHAAQFKQERIESTVFSLLSIHHSIVTSMEVKLSLPKTVEMRKGRECFLPLFNIYKEDYYKDSEPTDPVTKQISTTFQIFFEKHQEVLGLYFRNLYNIFKFLDNSDLSEDKKLLYAKLLRAQLSNYELLLLFYNGLSTYGTKWKVYITKYHLFNNLIIDRLIDSREHQLLYDKAAFS